LGIGIDYKDVKKLIKNETDIVKNIGQIIGIYCGYNSSYLLNSNFELFACGSNHSG
jgi:alpha-tubulin suppressor-like RCC1 family protein